MEDEALDPEDIEVEDGAKVIDALLDRLKDGLGYALEGGQVRIDTEDLRLLLRYVGTLEEFVNLVEDAWRASGKTIL